ncbi:MAG: M36 family metallopeptidase [Vicinamibacterales bacterium]
MNSRQLFGLITLVVTLSAGPAFAQQARDFSAKSARTTRGPNGAPVTGPSNAGRPAIVTAFLATRHSQRTVQSVVFQKENAAQTGVTHMTFGQRIAGLDVYGTYVRAAVSQRGEVLSVIENLADAPLALLPAVETHRGALESVLAEYYPGNIDNLPELRASGETVEFTRGARFTEDPKVTRVAVPMSNGAMQTGYLVITWDRDNILRHTVVGAGGRILVEELRTNTDSYMIFPNHPGVTAQTVVSGPAGWVTNNTTIGNNVDAYLDRDNNNAADTNGRPVSATRNFEYTFDLAAAPTTVTNQMAAVTNLFYLNNVIHDELYRHGFNEAAGNFQTNNFNKGGAGNDAVNAEAQDGGGTNNANFATPSDGSKPRMQMYIWNRTTPNRDGDLDSDIVYHEYGHGLTWRMIGSMSGPFAGAIGEGMSDTLAIYLNNNDVVGEYAYNSAIGIRRAPYTNYPNTYGDVTGSSVHADGEIYAAAMWKLRQLWLDSGRTQDALLDRIVDGMNFTPARPDYEAMRDGILAAMLPDEDCFAWRAFAQFGIGQGANGTESCNIFTCQVSITESFVVPAACSGGGGGGNTAPTVTITAPDSGASITVGSTATFAGSAVDAQDGTISPGLVWTSSINGPIGTGASVSTSTLSVGTHTITASSTDSGGLTTTASITFNVNAAPPPATITLNLAGRKVKGVNTVDLTWSGATTAVDIFRGTTKIVTNGLNDGAHTDNTGTKGGASLTYQVCETGTTVCSAAKTIVF